MQSPPSNVHVDLLPNPESGQTSGSSPSVVRSLGLALAWVIAYSLRRASQGGEITISHIALVAAFFAFAGLITWFVQGRRRTIWAWWLEGLAIPFVALAVMVPTSLLMDALRE